MRFCVHTTNKVNTSGTVADVRKNLQKILWEDTIPNVRCVDSKTMIFELVPNDDVLFHNSFLPRIQLDFLEEAEGTCVVIHAQVKQVTKIFMDIFRIVALVLETALLYLHFTVGIDPLFVLFLPVLLAVYSDCLAYVCLKRSARPFVKTIRNILKTDCHTSVRATIR